MGRVLLLIGLGAQLVFFSGFLSITVYVNKARVYGLRANSTLRPVFFCLYSTIALMFIRNIYRLAEFAQGYDAYIATHEAFFYVFDFTMIFSCFLLYACFHFGLYLGPKAKAIGTEGPKDGLGHLSNNIPVSANSSGTELIQHHTGQANAKVRLETV